MGPTVNSDCCAVWQFFVNVKAYHPRHTPVGRVLAGRTESYSKPNFTPEFRSGLGPGTSRLSSRLYSISQNSRCARSFTAKREVGMANWMAAVSGRTSPRVPLDRYPATPRPRDHHFAWPGATRRCFALLGAFPARRDEALRGALGIGGDGRGRVRVGRSGGTGLFPGPRSLSRPLIFVWRRVACR